MSRTMGEGLKAFAYRRAIAYMDNDPDKNVPKVLDWIDKHDKKGAIRSQVSQTREAIANPDNNWYKLVKSLWTDIDDGQRKSLFESVVVNDSLVGILRQKTLAERYNCNIPWAILMDPTSACNLHCTGCWAADYGNKLNMTFEQLDSIVKQGKELGVYLYILSGGEPLVRKDDIIRLCKKHQDCAFLSFTNGTLIDEAFAQRMLEVKNFVPAISVEGFEEDTDFRRGNGTYKAVICAMDILRTHKLLFGISCCYTSKNTDVIGSEAYIDDMIAKGAKFAWFFTYMPVGNDAVPELMVSAEQRAYLYRQVRAFRKTKPIFTLDFWNDGEYVRGCIAGGRAYLHINANGDIEPCAFIHYADRNIKDSTILDALRAPLFMAYHMNQPFNANHLRPCPLLDNPPKLAEMVDKSGAVSTDMKSREDVHSLCAKCTHAAQNWAFKAGELWEESHPEKETVHHG